MAAAFVAPHALGGELQWRSSRDAIATPLATDGENARSVVVNRGVEHVAQDAQFDPFEENVAMPEAAAPAAEEKFDPFEQDDALSADEEQPPAEDTADTSTDVQGAFEEPSFDAEVPTAADELEAAQEAIDRELMRREVESGAEDELVAPESDAADEQDALEAEPEMQDEIVPPTGETLDDQLDELMSDDGVDLELQYGEDLPQPELTPEQIELRRQQLAEERQRHLQECETLYEEVRSDSIKNISLDIRLEGTAGEDYPFECLGRNLPFQPRNWAETVYLWKASGLCHKPLYFEQVQLERYGHSWGPVLQPIMSGAHFFGTIPILPYKMGLKTPQECVYTLGYYRPGSCAPYMITQPGFTWRAAAFETAAVTGVSAVVP